MATALSNPHGCCLVPIGCCPTGVPEILTATAISSGDCSCADGASTDLVFDGDLRWTGSLNILGCSSVLELSLYCQPQVTPGTYSWRLEHDACSGASWLETAISGEACPPLNQRYFITNGGVGCCHALAASIDVIITE